MRLGEPKRNVAALRVTGRLARLWLNAGMGNPMPSLPPQKHQSWLVALRNRVGFEWRANQILRAITLVLIWVVLVWFGFYQIEAAERGEDTLLTWYVVVTATAVVVLVYQHWQESD
ncbi:MAG TPA: hypothetical protein VH684_23885 [Xanthobacteraceae bacterium]|jgi:hypothetical protein